MNKGRSTKLYLAFGLVCLMISANLAAIYFDFVPDRIRAVIEGRTALAEALAASSSALIAGGDASRLSAVLDFVVERNDQLQSAAVRRASGQILVQTAEHERNWSSRGGERSTDVEVQVPIWAAKAQWGQLELRFAPINEPGWVGMIKHDRAQMIAFIALTSFFCVLPVSGQDAQAIGSVARCS